MTRDYTDMMNMVPAELVRHALECAKVGIISIALVEALALQLETQAALAAGIENLELDLQFAKDGATQWREECLAMQRQLDKTYG